MSPAGNVQLAFRAKREKGAFMEHCDAVLMEVEKALEASVAQ